MDHLELLANTEVGVATKRAGIEVPDSPSNSSDAHRVEVQPQTAVNAAHEAAPKVPMVDSHGTQAPTVQKADGEEAQPTDLGEVFDHCDCTSPSTVNCLAMRLFVTYRPQPC